VDFVTPAEITEIVRELLTAEPNQAALGEKLALSQSSISHLKMGHAHEFVQHINTFLTLLKLRFELSHGELKGSPLVKLLQLIAASDLATCERLTASLQKQIKMTKHGKGGDAKC